MRLEEAGGERDFFEEQTTHVIQLRMIEGTPAVSTCTVCPYRDFHRVDGVKRTPSSKAHLVNKYTSYVYPTIVPTVLHFTTAVLS